MARTIFISYRRSDSQHAAFAIADRIGWAFGHHHVFFDRSSIEGGDIWPQTIQEALSSATMMLVIIGKNWLRATDDSGRRRIDDPTDWVNRELCAALARAKRFDRGTLEIIPVLLDGVAAVTSKDLDGPLQDLADCQGMKLNSDGWESGIESLIKALAKTTGLPRIQRDGDRNPNGSPMRPLPVLTDPPLSDEAVRRQLETLSRWELAWSAHPWGIDGYGQELTKCYDFQSFKQAISFMKYVAPEIERWKPPHHPRWENLWKVVNVFFTTWDIGCRVTTLDIDAAKKLDDLYLKFLRDDKISVQSGS